MLTSKKEYFWNGSVRELKSFVENDLGLSGKWTSPGGEVKLFTNTDFRLKWQGSSIKRLVIIKDDEKDYLAKALRKYAIDQSDDTERCSVELNRADAAKTKSPSDDCSKYDIGMAELKLDVAMLTALLHKDQEKLTSQSASIVEFQALTQFLLRENEKRAAELESVKASINRLASSDEYIIRMDDNEVNNMVSLASRSSIRRLDVHDSECVDTNKSKLSYDPPSTEYVSSNMNPIQSEKEIYSPSKLNSCSSVHKISIVNIDNEKTKEAKQLCDQVGQLKQNIPSSQGSKPNNYQYNQHIPTRITYRKQQLYSRRRLHAKRNYLRHNNQNNSWKSNDDALRPCERRQLEEGFRTQTRCRDKMKFYQFFY